MEIERHRAPGVARWPVISEELAIRVRDTAVFYNSVERVNQTRNYPRYRETQGHRLITPRKILFFLAAVVEFADEIFMRALNS